MDCDAYSMSKQRGFHICCYMEESKDISGHHIFQFLPYQTDITLVMLKNIINF